MNNLTVELYSLIGSKTFPEVCFDLVILLSLSIHFHFFFDLDNFLIDKLISMFFNLQKKLITFMNVHQLKP